MNKSLNIAIVGYGRMGQEIEALSSEMNCQVTHIFDINSPLLEAYKIYDFDVAIDFSQPDVVLNNIKILSKLNKNIVIGTTGWLNQYDEISRIVEDAGIGVVWSSNFSVGIQLFDRIVELASVLLNSLPEYDIFIHEVHHNKKLDAPSGTALSLADIIIKNLQTKKYIETQLPENSIQAKENLLVTSSRGGDVSGTHTIYIDSPSDTIELNHRAKNRISFARGALIASRWIQDKKGFYTFDEVISEMFKK